MSLIGSIIGSGGGGGVAAEGVLVSVSPLSNPDRWDPIVIVIEPHATPVICTVQWNGLYVVAYDGTAPIGEQFLNHFARMSSYEDIDPNPLTAEPRTQLTIIPNSGWQDPFIIKLFSGAEMTL